MIKSVFLQIIAIVSLLCYSTNNGFSHTFVQQGTENTLEFVSVDFLKSIQLKKQGTDYSIPAIELYGETIVLSFDDLSSHPGSYSYTVTHCDADWNPSSLFFSDYMDGFEVNQILDYTYSSGTVVDYMHCRVEVPNKDIKLKISGNYLIRVLNSYAPDEILIQKRFLVVENLVGIDAAVRQPPPGEMRYSGQQLSLSINTANLRVTNPYGEIKTVVCQNTISQGCYTEITPQFIQGDMIDFSHPDALIFNGMNEYRMFETRNIRYAGVGVQDITYKAGMFHSLLRTDKSRRNQKYSTALDFNGYYAINMERSSQSTIEADYLWVYFTLTTPVELNEGERVYVFGELTSWMLSPSNQMEYNPKEGAYELRLLLKQGAYNYLYAVGNSEKGTVDFSHYEGNFYDTENVYTILIYYKPLGARYHRIAGMKQIRS